MADSINLHYQVNWRWLTITQKIELEGGVDNQSTAIAGDFGTLTYHKHGGDSVMSGWDDMTLTWRSMGLRYNWYWYFGTDDEVVMINGRAGNALWRYDSPT